MFSADSAVESRILGFAQFDRHIHELAHALCIQTGERVGFIDFIFIVCGQELSGVVPAEAECHLCQIVGSEAEEIRFFRNFVRGEGGTGNLDHGAHLVMQVAVRRFDLLIGSGNDNILYIPELFDLSNQRDHDLGREIPVRVFCLHGEGRFDDRSCLHSGDFRISNAQAAAAMSHHGVELVQSGDHLFNIFHGFALCFCQLFNIGFRRGDKLMERRVKETDRDRMSAQRFKESLKISLLHGLNLIQCSFTFLCGLRADHLTERADAVRLKEHMLRPAKTDALRAESCGLHSVLRGVGVGAHRHGLIFVSKLHDPAEIAAAHVCGDGRDQCIVDIACGAVQRNRIALVEGFAAKFKLLIVLIHSDILAAGHTAGSHATGNDGRVGGLPAAHG